MLAKDCSCTMIVKYRLGGRTCLRLVLLVLISLCLCTLLVNLAKNRSSFVNLGPAFTMIQTNGRVHIDELLGFEEVSDEQKIYLMDKLRNSIHDLMKNCSEDDSQSKSCYHGKPKGKILTLFTTWVYDKDKFSVNNKTLYNWKALPNVNLVVFVSEGDNHVKEYSRKAGWDVLPVSLEATGAPVLPTMFQDVKKKYSSKFYAFANGDILFTKKLTDTLEKLICQLENGSIENNNGVLIVGRRINVPADKLSDKSAVDWRRLEEFANQYGKLFQSDAEDYFITDSKFPWSTFLPVVVGRRGFDNYVVAYSRHINVTVIDASESIQCIHQTLRSRGNFEGLAKGRYNLDLIEKQGMPFTFEWGRTFCTQWKSWYDLCDRLLISERRNVVSSCTSYKLSHRIATFFGFT